MIDPDHAKRVRDHQNTPLFIIAQSLSGCRYPSPKRTAQARKIIEDLVMAGYAIEPIEDDDE